jgi:hypothetical protein
MALEHIDRTVQSKFKANFRTLELSFPEPEIATFRRSRSMKLTMVMILVVGVVLGAGCPLFLVYGGFLDAFGRQPLYFLAVFELIDCVILVGVVFVYSRIRPLVFDKRQGRFWRQGKTDKAIGDYALLKDVEGVQVCSGKASGSEGGSYTVYELNVVMKRPPGARVSAICHGNREAVFEDALKLAEFLGVPPVDHTQSPQ